MQPRVPQLIKKEDATKYAFKQQILPAWKPVLTMKNTIPIFAFIAVLFIVLGSFLLKYSFDIVQVNVNYYEQCQNTNPCLVKFTVDSQMKAPVYLYIALTNYHQNHRYYMKSRSVEQLANLPYSSSECSPVITNNDMGKTLAMDGITNLDPNAVAVPCGLIAKSFFTDDYSYQAGPTPFTIQTTNIAWPSDKERLFKNSENASTTQWIDLTNERFINWMRISAVPNFKKLWGIIPQTLDAGEYTMSISNVYDTTQYGGSKGFVLSTANRFGGKNFILSYLYLVFGFISLIIAIAFLIKDTCYPEQLPSLKID